MKKILIVDDALFMRTVIRKNLVSMNAGYEIEEAANGEEAVRMYAQWHPDLVLMDITMPKKSGLEALEEIRQMDKEAMVIMCSAVGQEPMIVRATQLGAADFIVKPFRSDEFTRVIAHYLEGSV